MQNRFIDLPHELLVNIVEYLNADDSNSAAQADPLLNFIVTDVWRRRIERHFPGTVADYELEHIKNWPEKFNVITSIIYKQLEPKLQRLFYSLKEGQVDRVFRESLGVYDLLVTDIQKNSLLSLAIKSGNRSLLNYFYAIAIRDFRNLDPHGNSMLHWAVFCGQSTNVICNLIDAGADINQLSSTDKTPLMIAVEQRRLDVIKLLLEKKANVSIKNKDGKDALTIAVEMDDPQITDLLIRNGADNNALHIAASLGHIKTLKFLLARHADIDARDHEGTTPLDFALQAGHDEIAIELMNHGADINAAKKNKIRPLYTAVARGHTAMVVELLLRHADVALAEQNNPGFTLSYVAASNNRCDVLKVLLQHHVDINQTSIEDFTPLHIAVKHGFYMTAEFLLQHCANPNIANRYGMTPLHAAARRGDLPMTKLLLRYHANPFKFTAGTHKSAYTMASEHGHQEVANEIEKYTQAINKFLSKKLNPASQQDDISQSFNKSAVMVDSIMPILSQHHFFKRRLRLAPEVMIYKMADNPTL